MGSSTGLAQFPAGAVTALVAPYRLGSFPALDTELRSLLWREGGWAVQGEHWSLPQPRHVSFALINLASVRTEGLELCTNLSQMFQAKVFW